MLLLLLFVVVVRRQTSICIQMLIMGKGICQPPTNRLSFVVLDRSHQVTIDSDFLLPALMIDLLIRTNLHKSNKKSSMPSISFNKTLKSNDRMIFLLQTSALSFDCWLAGAAITMINQACKSN